MPWIHRLVSGAGRRALRRAIAVVLFLTLVSPLTGCAGRSAPSETAEGTDAETEKKPKRNILLTTEYDDQRVGRDTASDVAEEMGLLDDGPLADYVTAVGKRLEAHAPQRLFHYEFHVVDQATPNAFALPGGHIYVSRGLLAVTNSEDELACVIGHEIIHAAERHAARHQAQSRRLNPLAMGLSRLALIAENSRDSERDADRGGQILCAKAGYEPMALAAFLRDLESLERLTLGWSRLPGFLDTHPTSVERAAAAAARGQSLAWTPRTPIAGSRHDYLARLNGLVIGPNPAEGVFQGSRFLHPDLDFTLRFPEGWTLVNTRPAVGAISPQRNAQAVLTLDGPGDDPEAKANAFLEGEALEIRASITRAQPLQIGALPAYRVEGRSRTSGGQVTGQITWIAYKGLVYRITAAAPSSVAKQFVGRARSAARSFRPMSDEERASIEVKKLRIVWAEAGESLASLIARHDGDALDLATTAAVNDVRPDVQFAAGTPVKIGVREPYVSPEPPDEPSEKSDNEAEDSEG